MRGILGLGLGWKHWVKCEESIPNRCKCKEPFFLIPQDHRVPQAVLYPVGLLHLSEKELFRLSWVWNLIKRQETEPENWRYLRPEGARENTIKERGMQRGSGSPRQDHWTVQLGRGGYARRIKCVPRGVQWGNRRFQTPQPQQWGEAWPGPQWSLIHHISVLFQKFSGEG